MKRIKLKDIRYFYRDVVHGIKNLVQWLPVIWKDRQWDHWFAYAIFYKKLSLMENFTRHYGCHTRAKQDANDIKLAALLFKRLMDDEYFEKAIKRHEEKWGEGEFNWIDTDDRELVELQIKHANVITEKDKIQERKEFHTAIDHEQYMRQQDLDMVFELMKKKIQSWWD